MVMVITSHRNCRQHGVFEEQFIYGNETPEELKKYFQRQRKLDIEYPCNCAELRELDKSLNQLLTTKSG
jgi:hypothetical protein